MALPEQLLLSDLLRRRVRCQQGIDHGLGLMGWMHPPVHRLLGWASRPSAFGTRRLVWRLDQLRGLADQEAFVAGDPAETDQATLERLPSLWDAALVGAAGDLLGTVADAAVELRTGRIRHYLVARSDPRLPGSSRWRLDPDRIIDQQPGQVITGLQGLDDLPLARASVRQEFLRRSRRWRQQMGEETARWRDQVQQAGGRLEERLEGWLEEPPWESPERDQDRWPPAEPAAPPWGPSEPPWEPRDGAAASRPVPEPDRGGEPWDDGWEASSRPAAPEPLLHPRRSRPATPGPEDQDDPWV